MERIGNILTPGYLDDIRRRMEAHKRKGDSPTDRALDDAANLREADAKLASELVDAVDAAVNGQPIAERVQMHVDGKQASIAYDFTPQKAAE